MALDAGSRIAHYRLERKLGAGGMGEVYLARDEKLNRLVAIKLLTAADEGAKRRLAREARAAAGLDHPGICAVYEVGSDDVVGDFIAMQYIEGETLAARLRRGRMSPDEAMGIGAQIAEALVAAHRHGLVHRDLKPQNVIITPTGSARLLDFGLALHVPTTTEAANAVTSSRVTDPNMVLGTPSYMSPEQVRNEPADFRTDVFSLGCVLYECLTGHRAFGGATTAEVLGAILHLEPPPVSSVAPNIGPAYDGLCARMLDKIPGERFHSAEEALGAIRALTPSSHFSTKSLRVPLRRRRNRLVQLVAVAAIVVGGGMAWQWYQRSALPIPTPDALGWYLKGVDAMRDGAFLGARDAFTEATKLFHGYTQAYSRLAEANTALDDEQAARTALLEVSGNVSRWPKEERVRFDAAKSASLRHYADAIDYYRQLVDFKPDDAGRWVDYGRALETSPSIPRVQAQNAYQKAVDLDSQSAAARLRLGVILARAGKAVEGLTSIDQAIQLYRLSRSTEGEAEALLRKNTALFEVSLNDRTRREESQAGFSRVLQMTAGGGYPAQHVGALFGLAKVAYANGLLPEAEQQTREAVATASGADLHVLSATGLVDLGVTLLNARRYEEADTQFLKAVDIAKQRGAKRLEMRAVLLRAVLRVQMGEGAKALELVDAPLTYFQNTEDARLLADSRAAKARALDSLERYAEARALTEEVLRFAEGSGDNTALGNALENLAGQLSRLGRHPEALPYRDRLDVLQESLPQSYAASLAQHAELLVTLGRGLEAEALLGKLDRGIAEGTKVYEQQRPRIGQLRTLNAAIAQKWNDVAQLAATVDRTTPPPSAGGRVPSAVVFTRMLAEYALAQQGRSHMPIKTIQDWQQYPRVLAERREWAYWVALILLKRGEAGLAESIVQEQLSAPAVQENAELGWRLAAVAALAARQRSGSAPTPAAVSRRNTTPQELEAAWGQVAAATYFARPDLALLRKAVR